MQNKKIIWANWNTVEENLGGQETFGSMIARIFNTKSISYTSCENVLQIGLFNGLSHRPPIYQGHVIESYLKRYEGLFDLDLVIKNAGVGGYEKLKTPQIVVFQDPFYSIQRFFMNQGIFFGNFWHYNANIDLQRRTAKQAVKTVAVSNFMKNDLIESDIRCDKVIEEGVDINKFKPVEDKEKLKRMHGLPSDKKIGITVTKFINQKGWSIMADLVNKFPDIHWIIVLTEKIGSKPKLKNVTLVEEALGNLMPKLYNCADFHISTSPVESFGLASIEAASCGLPIIAYKTGWAWDWWDDKLGIRVDDWNTKSFENAISKLTNSDMAKYKPRDSIIEKGFTKERMEKDWKEFVGEILNNRTA